MQVKEGIFLALLVATLLLVAYYTTTLTKKSKSSGDQLLQQKVSPVPSNAGDADTSPEGQRVLTNYSQSNIITNIQLFILLLLSIIIISIAIILTVTMMMKGCSFAAGG